MRRRLMDFSGSQRPSLSFVGVSADDSHAAVGTWNGEFALLSLPGFQLIHKQSNVGGPVVIIETLVGSSLCALVVASKLAADEPPGNQQQQRQCREVQLWRCSRNGERLGSVDFPCEGENLEPIVALKLSRRRLVVFLDCPANEIWILDLKTLGVVRTLERRTICATGGPPKPPAYFPIGQAWRVQFYGNDAFYGALPSLSLAAVGALSLHPCVGLLAVPVAVAAVTQGGGTKVADVALVSKAFAQGLFRPQESLGTLALVELHTEVQVARCAKVSEGPLAAVAFNAACTLVVTVSVKGTVIRAWSVPNMAQLFCWRRGARPSRLVSVRVTWDSAFVVVLATTRDAVTSGNPPVIERGHTAHLFSCARALAPPARQQHLPPMFASSSASNVSNNSTWCSVVQTDGTNDNKEWSCVSCEDLTGDFDQIPMSPGLDGSTSSNALHKLHVLATTAKGALRHRLQDLVNSERIEMFKKESAINAPKAFAVAHIKHPPTIAGMHPPVMAVPSIRECVESGTVELRLLSASGYTILFCGDRRKGGELKIRSENFLNWF